MILGIKKPGLFILIVVAVLVVVVSVVIFIMNMFKKTEMTIDEAMEKYNIPEENRQDVKNAVISLKGATTLITMTDSLNIIPINHGFLCYVLKSDPNIVKNYHNLSAGLIQDIRDFGSSTQPETASKPLAIQLIQGLSSLWSEMYHGYRRLFDVEFLKVCDVQSTYYNSHIKGNPIDTIGLNINDEYKTMITEFNTAITNLNNVPDDDGVGIVGIMKSLNEKLEMVLGEKQIL